MGWRDEKAGSARRLHGCKPLNLFSEAEAATSVYNPTSRTLDGSRDKSVATRCPMDHATVNIAVAHLDGAGRDIEE